MLRSSYGALSESCLKLKFYSSKEKTLHSLSMSISHGEYGRHENETMGMRESYGSLRNVLEAPRHQVMQVLPSLEENML